MGGGEERVYGDVVLDWSFSPRVAWNIQTVLMPLNFVEKIPGHSDISTTKISRPQSVRP